MTASVSPPLTAVRRAVGIAALASWIGACLRGGSSADDLTDAAQRVGLHRVLTADEELPVVLALAHWRSQGLCSARLVLPSPGDPSGLLGPASVNRRAIAEGAAIFLTRQQQPDDLPAAAEAVVLLPSDDGAWPTYRVAMSAAATAAWPSLRQARTEFLVGVAGHGEALAALDVAADRTGMRELVVGEDEQPLPPLPAGLASDGRELLGRARLVAMLAAAASGDDGAAVSAAEATSRAAHLRSLSAIARRAIAASVSGP